MIAEKITWSTYPGQPCIVIIFKMSNSCRHFHKSRSPFYNIVWNCVFFLIIAHCRGGLARANVSLLLSSNSTNSPREPFNWPIRGHCLPINKFYCFIKHTNIVCRNEVYYLTELSGGKGFVFETTSISCWEDMYPLTIPSTIKLANMHSASSQLASSPWVINSAFKNISTGTWWDPTMWYL